eukprot:Blabericola_migrator_1__6802@NODE_3443_length_1773_cov_83_730950_g2141_i0_p1_GENE_NODE_3443_length_1773_cov_83_730950_g2141_i0NODE_3443_length_1773_cov_83_730950_g2141_i0_p1_ORF_typecomplete_len365_score33_60_NODE_3443_length_1773_cov_83_730950_g2141_i05831677
MCSMFPLSLLSLKSLSLTQVVITRPLCLPSSRYVVDSYLTDRAGIFNFFWMTLPRLGGSLLDFDLHELPNVPSGPLCLFRCCQRRTTSSTGSLRSRILATDEGQRSSESTDLSRRVSLSLDALLERQDGWIRPVAKKCTCLKGSSFEGRGPAFGGAKVIQDAVCLVAECCALCLGVGCKTCLKLPGSLSEVASGDRVSDGECVAATIVSEEADTPRVTPRARTALEARVIHPHVPKLNIEEDSQRENLESVRTVDGWTSDEPNIYSEGSLSPHRSQHGIEPSTNFFSDVKPLYQRSMGGPLAPPCKEVAQQYSRKHYCRCCSKHQGQIKSIDDFPKKKSHRSHKHHTTPSHKHTHTLTIRRLPR